MSSSSTSTHRKERIQKIVFLRHGIAKHNMLIKGKQPNLQSPAMLDPPLIYQGKQQALEIGERMSNTSQWFWKQPIASTSHHTNTNTPNIDLIITSPLTRCIQTSMIAFLPGSKYTATIEEPTFYCSDLCREAYGIHYPDKRRNKSILMKYWPNLAMDPNMAEFDTLWKENVRESIQELQQRIRFFLQMLIQRPESNIVVVTHGVWMEICFQQYCPHLLEYGKKRVYNCDAYTMDCISENEQFLRFDNPYQI